jgi:hypothetical protein
VTWQPRAVFGVQEARGEGVGGVTHLGCVQWALVVVVNSGGGGGRRRWVGGGGGARGSR